MTGEERGWLQKTNVVLFFKLSLLAVTLTFCYNGYGQNIQLCVFSHIMTHFYDPISANCQHDLLFFHLSVFVSRPYAKQQKW